MAEDHPPSVSAWIPMTDPRSLACLGKGQEELGELQAIIGRIIIQGLDGTDPDTGVPNKEALQQEIGDVLAFVSWAATQLKLDYDRIHRRHNGKLGHFNRWMAKLEERLREQKP